MIHMKAITASWMLVFQAFFISPNVWSGEAATYLHVVPNSVRIILGDKGSDYFTNLSRRPVELMDDESSREEAKRKRIARARGCPFVFEINERRYAVLQEGLVNCLNGDVIEETGEAWKVLTSPAISTELTPWHSDDQRFDYVVAAIEAHPSVKTAPAATEPVRPKPGVFILVQNTPVMIECGVLFEDLIRETLKKNAEKTDETLRSLRFNWDDQLLVDGVPVAWRGNELVNLTNLKKYTDTTGMLYECGNEFGLRGNVGAENRVTAILLCMRSIERLLFRQSKK